MIKIMYFGLCNLKPIFCSRNINIISNIGDLSCGENMKPINRCVI
jgi:hypothetical protein